MNPGAPCHAFDDRIETIEPLMPRSIMASAPYLVYRKFPLTAIVIARLNEARSSSSSPHACSQAALLMTMSIRSQACNTAPMFATTSASTLTSPCSARPTPPLRSRRRTAALAASNSRSLHATRAPYRDSASAIPLPMFGPAPVTSATFPESDTSKATSRVDDDGLDLGVIEH